MNMLNYIGSWASIVGLALTIITMLLAVRVNRKVNSILKAKSDKSYFTQKVPGCIVALRDVQGIAADLELNILFSSIQYSKIKQSMDLIRSSWDMLYAYESKWSRRIKKWRWEGKFKHISRMYDKYHPCEQKRQDVIDFLSELIIFLEKEQKVNE